MYTENYKRNRRTTQQFYTRRLQWNVQQLCDSTIARCSAGLTRASARKTSVAKNVRVRLVRKNEARQPRPLCTTTTIGGGGGGGVSFSQTPQKQVLGRGSDDEAGDESDAQPIPRIHKQYGTIIYNNNIICLVPIIDFDRVCGSQARVYLIIIII